MKLTNWNKPTDKPVRVGAYKRKGKFPCLRGTYSWWENGYFGICGSTPKDAKLMWELWGPALVQNLPWRGVTKDGK